MSSFNRMLTWRKTALNTGTNVCHGDGYAKLAHNLLRNLNAILGCVRLGNLDLDFEIRISDLQSNAKCENGFHLREIRPQGGFQLGNPITDFMDFLFTVRLGKPEKDSQNCSRELRSTFC